MRYDIYDIGTKETNIMYIFHSHVIKIFDLSQLKSTDGLNDPEFEQRIINRSLLTHPDMGMELQ